MAKKTIIKIGRENVSASLRTHAPHVELNRWFYHEKIEPKLKPNKRVTLAIKDGKRRRKLFNGTINVDVFEQCECCGPEVTIEFHPNNPEKLRNFLDGISRPIVKWPSKL